MQEIRCAICWQKEKTVELYSEKLNKKRISGKTYSARRTPDGMHHRFVKCQNCSLIFSNPVLSPKEIVKFYKHSTCNYGAETENIKETYFQITNDKLQMSIDPAVDTNNKKLKILDVGCGNGFFLEALVDQGFKNVFGVEPGKESVKKARKDIGKRIKTDILRPGVFKSGSFDVITCFQTLDHIIEVNKFLELVKKLLKRNGLVLFIVHDTQGLSVKLLGEKSPIFDIEHIYLFNKSNLEKLFKKNGFKNPSVFSVKNKYTLSYWVSMLPLPKKFKKIVNKSPIGRLPVTLGAGNIGLVATR